MSKTYRWETEREREQAVFLEAVVKTYTGWVGKPPKTSGFTPAQTSDRRSEAGPGQSADREHLRLVHGSC